VNHVAPSSEVDGLDEPLIAEVVECVVADVEIVLGHDAESADGASVRLSSPFGRGRGHDHDQLAPRWILSVESEGLAPYVQSDFDLQPDEPQIIKMVSDVDEQSGVLAVYLVGKGISTSA
jgi:hypothetical protein